MSFFGFGMSNVIGNDQRNVEENLFTFSLTYLMKVPILVRVPFIPFKTVTIVYTV